MTCLTHIGAAETNVNQRFVKKSNVQSINKYLHCLYMCVLWTREDAAGQSYHTVTLCCCPIYKAKARAAWLSTCNKNATASLILWWGISCCCPHRVVFLFAVAVATYVVVAIWHDVVWERPWYGPLGIPIQPFPRKDEVWENWTCIVWPWYFQFQHSTTKTTLTWWWTRGLGTTNSTMWHEYPSWEVSWLPGVYCLQINEFKRACTTNHIFAHKVHHHRCSPDWEW